MKTRDHILATARTLIYQQGYEQTSISHILEAAQVGKGQLYYYFDSKKQIGLEVTRTIIQDWERELFQEIFEADLTAAQKLQAMLDWNFSFHQQETVHYGCPIGNLIAELSVKDQNFRALLDQFMKSWQSHLATLLQSLKTDWDQKTCLNEAASLIAQLQGAALMLKLTQDLTFLTHLNQDIRQTYQLA